ncbi:hypothetical protein R4B61_01685 [Fructilactobacillus vespulae]|uniref:hypothetical protein n=1 Tax=Fructilactobacillus vespulae TaxID=1249630 RepID=UPI0039B57D07
MKKKSALIILLAILVIAIGWVSYATLTKTDSHKATDTEKVATKTAKKQPTANKTANKQANHDDSNETETKNSENNNQSSTTSGTTTNSGDSNTASETISSSTAETATNNNASQNGEAKAIETLKTLEFANNPDLVYEVMSSDNGVYTIRVVSKSIRSQGGSGTAGVYNVYPDGYYKFAY